MTRIHFSRPFEDMIDREENDKIQISFTQMFNFLVYRIAGVNHFLRFVISIEILIADYLQSTEELNSTELQNMNLWLWSVPFVCKKDSLNGMFESIRPLGNHPFNYAQFC
jgi:hypothetical protein